MEAIERCGCGEDAELLGRSVRCTRCGLTTGELPTAEAAVEMWNHGFEGRFGGMPFRARGVRPKGGVRPV